MAREAIVYEKLNFRGTLAAGAPLHSAPDVLSIFCILEKMSITH